MKSRVLRSLSILVHKHTCSQEEIVPFGITYCAHRDTTTTNECPRSSKTNAISIKIEKNFFFLSADNKKINHTDVTWMMRINRLVPSVNVLQANRSVVIRLWTSVARYSSASTMRDMVSRSCSGGEEWLFSQRCKPNRYDHETIGSMKHVGNTLKKNVFHCVTKISDVKYV